MNDSTKTNSKDREVPTTRESAGSTKPLWPDNPSVADFEREFYRESVESLIEAEEDKALSKKPLSRLARSIRSAAARLVSLFSWRPHVSVPSVDLESVIRTLETPVQQLKSTYSEQRRREHGA